jgi:hypothetical protein
VSSTSHQSSGLAQLLLRGHPRRHHDRARAAALGPGPISIDRLLGLDKTGSRAPLTATPWPTRRFTTTQPPNITFSS